MKLAFLLQLTLLLACSNNEKCDHIVGHYASENGYSTFDISTCEGDVIKGSHCFVSANGEFIDSCLDSTQTFTANKIAQDTYSGALRSCYIDSVYFFEIQIKNDTINLNFADQGYPFKTNQLIKRLK